MSMHIEGQLWAEAIEYFGDQEKAIRWFQTPNLVLGGETPGEYCTSHYSGDQTVRELIIRMQYGMLS